MENLPYLKDLGCQINRRRLRNGLLCGALNSQRYYLTPYGWKLARLYARLEARIFRPALTAMNDPPAALPARAARPRWIPGRDAPAAGGTPAPSTVPCMERADSFSRRFWSNRAGARPHRERKTGRFAPANEIAPATLRR